MAPDYSSPFLPVEIKWLNRNECEVIYYKMAPIEALPELVVEDKRPYYRRFEKRSKRCN